MADVDLAKIICLGLSIYTIMIVWFKGSMFTVCRAKLEALSETHWWAYPFTCPICLPFYLLLILLGLSALPLGNLLFYILAPVGLAIILHQLTQL